MIFIIAFLITVVAHPTYYKLDRNETCFKEQKAKILSWHAHILWLGNNQQSTQGAIALREQFNQTFYTILGPICSDFFHQDYNCLFEPEWQPTGPFPTAQWSVFFMPEQFSLLVPWLVQNRNEYDLLVHPNTGCQLEDHSWWALWSGTQWRIDTDTFIHDYPFPWPEESKKLTQIKKVRQSNNIQISGQVKQFLQEFEYKI